VSLYPPPFERPAFNEMQAWLYALYEYVTAGPGNFDVRAYGATPTSSGAVNRVAIQAAIDACIAAGGGSVLIPAAFNVAGTLTINTGVSGIGLTLQGLGRGVSILRQTTVGSDLIVGGANRSQVCDNLVVRDLTLDGTGVGGKLLRLNNCLNGVFERLYLTASAYGIYTEGQNERHAFRDLYLQGFTSNGILTGQSNGETIFTGTLDYPVLQKCLFENVRVGGCDGKAVVITAGILDGVQRTSGINRLDRIVLEGNKQNGVEFHFSFMSAISGLSNEDYLDTNGVYYALLIEDGSMVSARDLYLGCGAQVNDYAAKIRVNGGYLFLSDSTVSGAHVSAVGDISVLGTLEASNVIVTDKNAIVFDNTPSADKSLLRGVQDAAGASITDWATTIHAVAPKSSGVYVPQLTVATMTIRVVDAAGQLVGIFETDGSAFNRLVFGGTTASEAGFQFDHAAGIKAIKGDVSGLASFYAAHFYLETRPDYTVNNPATRRTLDVNASTLQELREIVGTMLADDIAAGLKQ
jgi:hypothetical protein